MFQRERDFGNSGPGNNLFALVPTMNVNHSKSQTPNNHLPIQISSDSSLDSFLIDLPVSSDFQEHMNATDNDSDRYDTEEFDGHDPTGNNNMNKINGNQNCNNHGESPTQRLSEYEDMDAMSRAFSYELESSNINNVDVAAAAGRRFSEVVVGQHDTETPCPLPAAAAADSVAGKRRASAPASVSSSSEAFSSTTVPEFLYQLTKMLTDDNRDVIEWCSGRIEVHSPQKLESHVLKRYFRHSKFASFQRQLNYFGFRKLAGKGKMAPCSYVNDAAMEDISSLFHIKRKSGSDPPENPSKKKRDVVSKTILKDEIPPINPVLAGIYSRSSDFQRKPLPARTVSGRTIVLAPEMEPAVSGATTSGAPLSTHQALARQAVGRGIRHELGRPKEVPSSIKQPTFPTATGSLTELASNYHSSLFSTTANDVGECNDNDPTPLSQMEDRPGLFSEVYSGFLSRNSSLVDLAMIAPVDDGPEPMQSNHEFGFVDFPNPEDHQSNQNGF